MSLPPVDTQFLLKFLTDLLNIPSPSGFTEAAMDFIESAFAPHPTVHLARTTKGALVATMPGQHADQPRSIATHVDTLGAMVKEIKSNGRLKLARIGGLLWNTVETEGCNVITSGGESLRGSILYHKASGHVFKTKVLEGTRDEDSMEVRLDARTTSEKETRALGIDVGDFVMIDPRVEVTNNFVRSRFLDDKACVACVLAAVKSLYGAGLVPVQKTSLFFSNYEEVGHGAASGIPADAKELLVLDMAVVGEGQTSDEFHCSLCAKDASGPYHHGMSQRLRQLAQSNGIAYKVDVYTYYGSDGSAFLRAGGDVNVALIGPGIEASHNYERTHLDALVATTQWILAYLIN